MTFLSRKPVSPAALALGLAGVAAVTLVFTRLLRVNASTVGFCFLIVVLGIATLGGFRVSALVSLAAMLSLNYFFLPPVGRFTIADPENWVALATFLVTALVASHLSDRAQKQAAEARRRQLETEQLYSLSRAILLTESSRPIGTQAAHSIAQIFQSSSVTIFDAKSGLAYRGGSSDIDLPLSRLEDVVRLASHQRDDQIDIDIWPISLGGDPIGALAAVALRTSDGAIQSILNLVAIALERVRTQEASNRADAARQSEEFKSTLLDAIAHEFKTPLTSIKAAATGLRAFDDTLPPDQRELAAIIDEETDRLSALVTEAVKMAEIDAGKVRLHKAPTSLTSLLQSAIATFENRGADRIAVDPGPDATLLVDRELLNLALRQVLDNALKYSEPAAPVRCYATAAVGSIDLRILDLGPGIPDLDRSRIFDKFFRRPSVREQVPGSGLGLHIAREITRMHGGDLWAESREPRGAAFCFRLPIADKDAQ
jgi:two-component system sensor histidine kinase KdpD